MGRLVEHAVDQVGSEVDLRPTGPGVLQGHRPAAHDLRVGVVGALGQLHAQRRGIVDSDGEQRLCGLLVGTRQHHGQARDTSLIQEVHLDHGFGQQAEGAGIEL